MDSTGPRSHMLLLVRTVAHLQRQLLLQTSFCTVAQKMLCSCSDRRLYLLLLHRSISISERAGAPHWAPLGTTTNATESPQQYFVTRTGHASYLQVWAHYDTEELAACQPVLDEQQPTLAKNAKVLLLNVTRH